MVIIERRNDSREMSVFFFNDTATTEIYTLSLHDAASILGDAAQCISVDTRMCAAFRVAVPRSYKGEIPQRGRVCGAQILNKPVGSEDEAGGLSNTVRRCLNKACNGDGSIFKRDAADQGAACFQSTPAQRISMDCLRNWGQDPNVPATIVCDFKRSGRAKAGAGPCHSKAFGI